MLFVIMSLFALTAYLMITSKVTPEERDEMLKDKEMWP
jgi:hypothetical protein